MCVICPPPSAAAAPAMAAGLGPKPWGSARVRAPAPAERQSPRKGLMYLRVHGLVRVIVLRRYEKGGVGGRLKNLRFGNESYELGGSMVYQDNMYIRCRAFRI